MQTFNNIKTYRTMEKLTKSQFKARFMNHKVYTDGKIGDIMLKLRAAGFRTTDIFVCEDSPFLIISKKEFYPERSMRGFKEHRFDEVKAEDILGVEIVDDPKQGFKPYDKVLVRDSEECEWQCDLFSHYSENPEAEYPYHCVGESFTYCIPFEGNEHLVGTTHPF